MNTTSLFVELLVIGVGAAIWVLLLTLSIFGYEWFPPDKTLSILDAIPILAVVYVLGIVSDRMIDLLFSHLWGSKARLQQFPDAKAYHEARRKVLTSSDAMSKMIEYSRSRIRICRGWSVHSILIACAIIIFAWTRLPDRQLAVGVSIFGATAFFFLGFASWYAWRYLNATQYLKIRDYAEFLDRKTKP